MTLVRHNKLQNILVVILIGLIMLASCGRQESSGGRSGKGVPRGWDTKALVK